MNLKLQTQTSKRKLGLSRNIFSVSLVALVAGIHQGADASTLDFRAAAQATTGLIHQWGFDGADVATAGRDLEGTANLAQKFYGNNLGGVITPIGYDQLGYDGTSKAFRSNRSAGSDGAGGGYLKAETANPVSALGSTFSFEVIVKPDQAAITGGSFNLGYILSSRSADNNSRGYFLVQGLPPAGATSPLSSIIGGGSSLINANTITPSALTVGDWYYVAGSYTANGTTNVTWTNYYANLTAGGPLVTSGPFTNSAGTYPMGAAREFGIGGRYDGQEAFPGFIDEVNLYSTALSSSDFQAHLTQLAVVPEPSTVALLSLGLLSLARRRRPATAV